jgi:hypothetical protein
MTALLAAVQELLEFGFGWLWSRPVAVPLEAEMKAELPKVLLPAPKPPVALPPEVQVETKVGTALVAASALVAVPMVRVWQRPVMTFDGEVIHLPYATPLKLLGYEGRFAQISKDEQVGWVLKDEITTDTNEIFPQFNTGEIYSANHPETKKIRRLLKDEFAAQELFLPLQDVELVSYLLYRKGLLIPWDAVRPRIAGTWQNILKGKPTVSIGISPKTGSIMEFIYDDGTGFVGYVEAVTVDESITVSGIGRLIAGEFRREVLPRVVWQEWRPVFIQLI